MFQDERMVGPLLDRCRDSSADVREWAARALGAYGDPVAIGAVSELLDDPNENVRHWAGLALSNLQR